MKLVIQVHVHNDHDDLKALVQQVIQQGDNMAVTVAQLLAAFATLNTVTSDLSAKADVIIGKENEQLMEIAALKAQIAAGSPVTQAQLDALGASVEERVLALTAVRDRLAPLAADVENPDPNPEPDPDPNPEV